MQTLTPILQILFLAFLAESLTEYLARPVLAAIDYKADRQVLYPFWLRYVAAAVGIGLAIAYKADLLAMLGLTAASPWIGYIITGILIGRGSNYLHDLVTNAWFQGTETIPKEE